MFRDTFRIYSLTFIVNMNFKSIKTSSTLLYADHPLLPLASLHLLFQLLSCRGRFLLTYRHLLALNPENNKCHNAQSVGILWTNHNRGKTIDASAGVDIT